MVLLQHVDRQLDAVEPARQQERPLVVDVAAAEQRVVGAVAGLALAQHQHRSRVLAGDVGERVDRGQRLALLDRDGQAGRLFRLRRRVHRVLPNQLEQRLGRRAARDRGHAGRSSRAGPGRKRSRASRGRTRPRTTRSSPRQRGGRYPDRRHDSEATPAARSGRMVIRFLDPGGRVDRRSARVREGAGRGLAPRRLAGANARPAPAIAKWRTRANPRSQRTARVRSPCAYSRISASTRAGRAPCRATSRYAARCICSPSASRRVASAAGTGGLKR